MADIFEHGGRRLSAALLAALLCIFATGVAFGATVEDTTVDENVGAGTTPGTGKGALLTVSGSGDATAGADLRVVNEITSLTVDNGNLLLDRDLRLTGTGTITIAGSKGSGSMSLWGSSDNPYAGEGNKFTMDGGTLTVGNNAHGAGFDVGSFHMSGGTVNVGGTGTMGTPGVTDWANANSFITAGFQEYPIAMGDEDKANASISLTGGVVNLYANGRIQSVFGDPYFHLFHINFQDSI